MICFDSDDFGSNHEISDMCQSHDCRDVLMKFKEINPAFKATLFAIPGEMTWEIADWCKENSSWVELAVHGFFHTSNYECEKMDWPTCNLLMEAVRDHWGNIFTKGFKAPGWQISDDIFKWLKDNDWWVADQHYNNARRPALPVYLNSNGIFSTLDGEKRGRLVNGIHTHTWNCVGNGVYELFDQIVEQIKDETEFKFVSEVINGH